MDEDLITKKVKKERSDKANNFIFDIITIICIVIIAIAVTPKSFQNDTFYNIKCGNYIFEHGVTNIAHDPFSWHNLPYSWPHWLYDLLTYVFYAMCGRFWTTGIYVLTMILTAILGFSIYKTSLKLTNKNRIVSGLASLFALYLLKPYIAARAQLVTFILFVWEIFFIEKLLETNKKRYGLALLFIAFLIVQLHCAVFPMFFVFALPYLAEFVFIVLSDLDLDEVLFRGIVNVLKKFTNSESKKEKYLSLIEKSRKNVESRKIKREKSRKNPYKVIITKNKAMITLIIVLIIALLLGFVNPMGKGAFTYTYNIYRGNTTNSINEHLPLTLADNMEFAFMLIIMFAILILIDIKVRLSDLLMIAGTLILSFKARRQVSLVVIMCMPILAKLIADFLAKYDENLCKMLKKLATNIVGMIVIVAIVTLIGRDMYKEKENNEYIETNSYPVEAAEWLLTYMKDNNIAPEELKLYNEYNYGSYLLFKGIPVFIDSRCDLYTPEFNGGKDIFTDALAVPRLNSDYENIFKKYGVRHVMLYANDDVNEKIKKDANYSVIYGDGKFTIYKRLNAE